MVKNNNLSSLINSAKGDYDNRERVPSYGTPGPFEPSRYEMRDILIGTEELKYRPGSTAKWRHADPAQLLDPESAGLPEDLIEEVEGDLERFNLVEDGAPVHVFLDSMYRGTLNRNPAGLNIDPEKKPIGKNYDTQVDAVTSPKRLLKPNGF